MKLLDMEEKLAADAGGRYRDSLLAELDAQAASVKRTIDRGLSPDEFRRMSALREALDAARSVVTGAWSRYNPS